MKFIYVCMYTSTLKFFSNFPCGMTIFRDEPACQQASDLLIVISQTSESLIELHTRVRGI